MTKHARWLQVLTALSLAGIVGCDEDLASLNDEMLDQGEAVELGGMLITSLTELAEGELSDMSSNAALAVAEPAAAMDRLTLDWKKKISCSPDGEVEVEGEIKANYDPRSREAEAEVEAEFKHDGCSHAGKDATYMISGRPGIKFKAELRTAGDRPKGEQTVALEGTFAWEDRANREGECEIDIVGKVSADGRTRSLNGGFCGHSFKVESES